MERKRNPGLLVRLGNGGIALRSNAGYGRRLRTKLRQPLGLRRIFGRVDVKERIDRLRRPVRNRNAVASGPYFDLAKTFCDKRVPQILTQGDGP